MRRSLFAVAVAALSVEGCYLGNSTSTGSSSHGSGGATGATSDGGSSRGAIDASASGLPCGVVVLLDRYCVSCHSANPANGVVGSLLTYQDLAAKAKSEPSKTVGALALSRMKDGSMPPPPSTSPPAADVDALSTWIAGGMQRDACTMAIDAGTPAKSPYDTPLQCSSGTNWTFGDRESPLMHPGGACISCHENGEGPRFAAAGTVFPTAHEPYDCNGSDGSAEAITVTLTDSAGKVIDMPANSAGNFYYRGALTPPYHAKVTIAGRTRAMSAAQTSGDCNSCHTVTGQSDAPGRIMAP